MQRAIALLVPLLLAGCSAPEALRGADSDAPREPYYKEHRATLDGAHSKLYDIPVEPAARVMTITITLHTRTNGLPAPDATPGKLDVTLIDPTGAPIATDELDAQRPTATITLDPITTIGPHRLDIRGIGATHQLEDNTYGTAYTATIEVSYDEPEPPQQNPHQP